MQKMQKITMEKKEDTFTQIVTIYYINISLSFLINSALLHDLKTKQKYERKEEENTTLQLKKRKPSLLADLLASQLSTELYIGKRRSRRRDEVTRQKLTRGSQRWPCFCGHTRDLGPWFWRAIFSHFRDLSNILGFGYLRPDFHQTRANVQIQCIFQKLSSLASKKSRFNYVKMGLIKLLLPFCPSSLNYLQNKPKHR